MDLDEFSDDGLDDLQDTELQQLESNAIQFTQANFNSYSQQDDVSITKQEPSNSAYGLEEEEDDLDTAEVTNDNGVPVGRILRDPLPSQNSISHLARRPIPPVPNPNWNPTINASRPLGAGPASGYTHGSNASQSRFQSSQFGSRAVPANSQPNDVLSALQQRVRTLEADLNAARGETSILRSNAIKSQREYDAQLSRIKKLNAEQSEKHSVMMQAAAAAEKSANTELEFLQRDLKEKQMSDRAKKKDGTTLSTAANTTPKKIGGRHWGFADGFDEMDIALSPSKGHGRGKNSGSVAANVGERTPSKGKRKRPVIDSPIMALEVDTGEDVSLGDALPPSSQPGQPLAMQDAVASFSFLQIVLDHGSFRGQPPTFDTLSRFAFASEPNASLSSLIFERLPLMGNPHRPLQLLVDFADCIISLWNRCYEQQYWEPVKYLTQLLAFTFQLHATSVAPYVIRELVPIAQSTVVIPAEIMQSRLADGSFPNKEDYKFSQSHIEVPEVLSLLQVCALACATTLPDLGGGLDYTVAAFWSLISFEFVLMLLSPKQRPEDTIAMLDLLGSSSLKESIGPITDDKVPEVVARAIIERVSAKLIETSRSVSVTQPEQRRRIRSSALRTLIAFATHPFGAMQLAIHDNALPRLVTCLSLSLDELYDQSASVSAQSQLSGINPNLANLLRTSTKPLVEIYQIISQCILLIHALVTDKHTSNAADITRKLSVAHGGSQRYLLALGRLTFAEEDLVIEAGIDSEVAEAAHELLELSVTPDEGEGIGEAFGS